MIKHTIAMNDAFCKTAVVKKLHRQAHINAIHVSMYCPRNQENAKRKYVLLRNGKRQRKR